MKKLKILVALLLTISTHETKGWDEMEKQMKEQDDLMEKIKTLREVLGTQLGYILKFPHADSYAYYVVNKVNKKTCQIKWVDYCDGWYDDYHGEGGTISLEYIDEKIEQEKKLKELFGS